MPTGSNVCIAPQWLPRLRQSPANQSQIGEPRARRHHLHGAVWAAWQPWPLALSWEPVGTQVGVALERTGHEHSPAGASDAGLAGAASAGTASAVVEAETVAAWAAVEAGAEVASAVVLPVADEVASEA